jgi:carbamoyl-phosphate synthase small subunit
VQQVFFNLKLEVIMEALLALEDGRVFRGRSFGAPGERAGEIVFNTSMTGYQEILTDPSYKGQIVAMTYPLIGNYGVNDEDVESSKPQAEGFVVKEASKITSNWRSLKGLGEYLKEHNILGIEGVDTRALTRHIRTAGAMKSVLSTECLDEAVLVRKAQESPGLIGRDLVKEVTCQKLYQWSAVKEREKQSDLGSDTRNSKDKVVFRVVAIDCGIKTNILRMLDRSGCEVTVVPAHTSAEEVLTLNPDGLLLSNGPGDPAAVPYVAETMRKLIGKMPIFGICLGHQILGLALGGKTYKLKFGHRGGNQPVKDLATGKVSITAQNHGFSVDSESLNKNEIELTHINLNDHTLEGMKHKTHPVFSVQYHPESSPGPHDAAYLFDDFIHSMERWKNA